MPGVPLLGHPSWHPVQAPHGADHGEMAKVAEGDGIQRSAWPTIAPRPGLGSQTPMSGVTGGRVCGSSC